MVAPVADFSTFFARDSAADFFLNTGRLFPGSAAFMVFYLTYWLACAALAPTYIVPR
jgi:hypothetical protein